MLHVVKGPTTLFRFIPSLVHVHVTWTHLIHSFKNLFGLDGQHKALLYLHNSGNSCGINALPQLECTLGINFASFGLMKGGTSSPAIKARGS